MILILCFASHINAVYRHQGTTLVFLMLLLLTLDAFSQATVSSTAIKFSSHVVEGYFYLLMFSVGPETKCYNYCTLCVRGVE
jgi:hypothetical protein